jgi:EAL domain-containing protein (putative c-di-GMP-specific phosphodiesterase class I)
MPSFQDSNGGGSRPPPRREPRKHQVKFDAGHLADAIERRLLHVEYQPKVPLESKGAEFAVEALCRLDHPEFGSIDPELFIRIAEQEGLIAQLTDVVVCRSFADLRSWRKQGFSVRLALNISPELLRTREWSEHFIVRCREFEIEPARIVLEITESSAGATLDVAFDVLTRLNLRGFTLSIDDFGTGFSSLAALYKLPFQELKIDKSFTFDLQKNPDARALIETTIGMAQRLGLKVVAEGVETEAVFRELRQMGCQQAQGYFISKSILAEKVPQFFSDWTSLMENEPIHNLNALPKIAIIQALLSDVLNDYGNDGEISADARDDDRPRPHGDVTLELTRKIPSLVLQGKVAAALARCQAAVRRLERDASRASLKAKILQLRHVLEQELICREDIQLAGACGSLRLLPRRSVLIGNPEKGKPVDIDLSEMTIVRPNLGLRLFAQGTDWFVEPIDGRANGNSVSGGPIAIAEGETSVNIGEVHGEATMLRFVRPRGNPNAVVVDVVPPGAGRNATETPRCKWIVFDGRISLGESRDCAIPLPKSGAEDAAEIWFENGFWIAPGFSARLTMADAPFTEQTPLSVGAEICIGEVSLRVEALFAGTSAKETAGAEVVPLRVISA